MIAIALLMPLFSGCSRHPNANEISKIQKLGGHVAIDPADNAVAKVWLTQAGVVDADLEGVAGCRRTRELYLSHSQVTDEGLKLLADLPVLVKLDLFHTRIGDAGLANLAKLDEARAVWALEIRM